MIPFSTHRSLSSSPCALAPFFFFRKNRKVHTQILTRWNLNRGCGNRLPTLWLQGRLEHATGTKHRQRSHMSGPQRERARIWVLRWESGAAFHYRVDGYRLERLDFGNCYIMFILHRWRKIMKLDMWDIEAKRYFSIFLIHHPFDALKQDITCRTFNLPPSFLFISNPSFSVQKRTQVSYTLLANGAPPLAGRAIRR